MVQLCLLKLTRVARVCTRAHACAQLIEEDEYKIQEGKMLSRFLQPYISRQLNHIKVFVDCSVMPKIKMLADINFE